MIGAIITAAGMSSRMGAFKPLLKIDDQTIIERVISTLQSGGVDIIVIICGNEANRLEKFNSKKVILIKNKNYQTNQMLDSIKLGVQYLKEMCQKILITPVDMPLFTESSIKTLIESQHDVTYISYKGKKGHPLMVNKNVYNDIIQFNGELGLKGVLIQQSDKIIIPVNDIGIVMDADTLENYIHLLEVYYFQKYDKTIDLSSYINKFDKKIIQFLYVVKTTVSIDITCDIMHINDIELYKDYINQVYLNDKGKNLLQQYNMMLEELNNHVKE